MKLNMFENAIDSIRHGIEHFIIGKNDPKNYKYSIHHVCNGVELLLKQRLADEYKLLIYQKIEKKGSSTVGIDDAVKRLARINPTIIREDEIERIERIKKARNRIEHYGVDISKKDAEMVIGDIIPFLIRFLREEFGKNLRDFLDMEQFDQVLYIEKAYSEALKIAEEEAKEKTYEHKAGYPNLRFCPWCYHETFVMDPEDAVGKCTMCDKVSELATCDVCGSIFSKDDVDAEVIEGQNYTCPDCMAHYRALIEKD
ncbi:MAG: hypothetical protein DDT23_01118 [candidate division WS2 bacterium]|nr:hypothetical protein [Candidatus Lithacetigena glycinireducens]